MHWLSHLTPCITNSNPAVLHRTRLVRLSSDSVAENATVVFPESSDASSTQYIQATVPASKLNAEIFDVGFTAAIGCALYKDGAGCEEMKRELRFADAVQLSDHWNYKYLIDLDGMGYSAHFLAFMASQSAVLKSTVYREFFSDWIQPWYVLRSHPSLPISNTMYTNVLILFPCSYRLHYIPVSQTYNDLYNIHAYFSGPSKSVLEVARHVYPNLTAPLPPPDGTAESSASLGEHEGDRRLRMIARAGRQWKKTQTRRVDQESTS